FINPKEAQLIDKSQGLHIRFRLGGEQFPPIIYYKIYIHNNLVDLNAFAPRDYTQQQCKLPLPQTMFLKMGALPVKQESDSWYSRVDSNGWRPVLDLGYQHSANSLVQDDSKKSPFHYSKLCRKDTLLKRKKQRQIQWMKQLYAMEQNGIPKKDKVEWLDLKKGLAVETASTGTLSKPGKTKHKQSEHEWEEFLAGLEAKDADDALINWTRALNFDSYHSDWLSLAATAPSNNDALPFPAKPKPIGVEQCEQPRFPFQASWTTGL
ncbi:hypothetical protein HDU91_005377, partial [Kappamyces sp. JEL0680]